MSHKRIKGLGFLSENRKNKAITPRGLINEIA